ncbi:MAG TPA: hypothetical protein VMU08_14800 [Rhizomicrobium sp.]|nr:hypothetical protein [Rhizomicrobium sp.]
MIQTERSPDDERSTVKAAERMRPVAIGASPRSIATRQVLSWRRLQARLAA